jgi:hypothetical protein
MEQGVCQGGEDVGMLQMGRCGAEDGRSTMIQDDTLEMDDRSLGLFQLLNRSFPRWTHPPIEQRSDYPERERESQSDRTSPSTPIIMAFRSHRMPANRVLFLSTTTTAFVAIGAWAYHRDVVRNDDNGVSQLAKSSQPRVGSKDVDGAGKWSPYVWGSNR